jgi:Ca2+-transporting ATPase
VLFVGLWQGMGVLAMVLAVFLLAQARHLDEPTTRAMAFTTLVLANLGLIFANRSHSRSILATLRTRNAALWWITGGTVLLLGLVLAVPAVRDLFTFSLPPAPELLLCLAVAIASLLWFEVVKSATRRYVKHE